MHNKEHDDDDDGGGDADADDDDDADEKSSWLLFIVGRQSSIKSFISTTDWIQHDETHFHSTHHHEQKLAIPKYWCVSEMETFVPQTSLRGGRI